MRDQTPLELRKKINDVAELVSTAAQVVHMTLGPGFLEKVYENALAHELCKYAKKVEQQRPIQVHYDGVIVGDYNADIMVDDVVVVELKAAKALDEANMAQCINYLKATGVKLCLLINFGAAKVEIRRVVYRF